MTRASLRTGVATLALASFMAAGMTAAPVSLSDDFSLEIKTAEAKNGKGGGNDKGGRGGNDKGGKGGNGGGNGKSGGSNSASAGASSSSIDGEDDDTEETEIEAAGKKGMGSLNASNSSQRARERASPNSRPGALGEYERALAEGDIEAAAEALARAANKEITPENVGKVNENLGIETTPEEEAEMAALAEAARSADPDAEGEPEGEDNVAEGEGSEGDGTTEEGLDEIAAAAENLISGEDADDWEVH